MRVQSTFTARYFCDPSTVDVAGQPVEVPFDHVLVDQGEHGYEVIPREKFLERYDVVEVDDEDKAADLLGRMADTYAAVPEG